MKKEVKMPVQIKPTVHTVTVAIQDVLPEHFFNVVDGKVLRNLLDLVEALDTISEDVFNFHVNEYKNDFARWIDDTMLYHDLAGRLDAIKDRRDHQLLLLKYLLTGLK